MISSENMEFNLECVWVTEELGHTCDAQTESHSCFV